jgi:hypothetical protein
MCMYAMMKIYTYLNQNHILLSNFSMVTHNTIFNQTYIYSNFFPSQLQYCLHTIGQDKVEKYFYSAMKHS